MSPLNQSNKSWFLKCDSCRKALDKHTHTRTRSIPGHMHGKTHRQTETDVQLSLTNNVRRREEMSFFFWLIRLCSHHVEVQHFQPCVSCPSLVSWRKSATLISCVTNQSEDHDRTPKLEAKHFSGLFRCLLTRSQIFLCAKIRKGLYSVSFSPQLI